jgi:tetrahydromethanopterin S-methyltransferase subunit C
VSLRVVRADDATRTVRSRGTTDGDGWSSRLAKLIPAEALGLYGTGQALVPPGRAEVLAGLAFVCLLFAAALRYVATMDPRTGKPQWVAIAIAGMSFILWVVALRPPVGPLDLGDNYFLAALVALIWGAVVPAFYKGD